MIDKTKILAKLRVINENLVKLGKLKEVPEEVFNKEFEKHDSAKYKDKGTFLSVLLKTILLCQKLAYK